MDIEMTADGNTMKLARIFSVLIVLAAGYVMFMRTESATEIVGVAAVCLVVTGIVACIIALKTRAAGRGEITGYFKTALGCMILLLVAYSTLMYFHLTLT